MYKILILILLLHCVTVAATRTWSSASSTDMNAVANYSGSGALLTTDDLVFNNTSVVNAAATANLDVASVTIASNYTGTWSISGMELICETGNFSDDGITGAHNYGNKITLNGASATLHVGSGVGTITASSCSVAMNGTTGMVIDDDKATTFSMLILGADARVTNSGATTSTYAGTTVLLVMTEGAELVVDRIIRLELSSSASFITLPENYSITGNSQLYFLVTASSVSDTVPSIVTSGVTQVALQCATASRTGWNIYVQNVNVGGSILASVISASGANGSVSHGGKVTCGIFREGTTSASCVLTSNCGSDTFTVASVDMTTFNTGSHLFNMQSSVWGCAGNWAFGSTHTVNSGTSKVVFSGSGKTIITAIDSTKPFYDLEIAKTGSAVCTLSATTYLKAHEFRITSGKTYLPCSLSCNSYLNLSSDTATMTKNKYIVTSFYRASTANARADTAWTFFTGNVAHDISADTGYTLGRFKIVAGTANWLTGAKVKLFQLPVASKSLHTAGKLFAVDSVYDIEGTAGNLDTIASATPGSRFALRLPATDTLRYTAMRDCSSSVAIYLDTGCQNLGNNYNVFDVVYTATIDTVYAAHSNIAAPDGLTAAIGATLRFVATVDAGYIGSWDGGTVIAGVPDTLYKTVTGDDTVTLTVLQIPAIDSIRKNPNYRSDSSSIYGTGYTTAGRLRNITYGADVSQKYWSATRIDFYTSPLWTRGWNRLVVTTQDSLRDTADLYIAIPRKTN